MMQAGRERVSRRIESDHEMTDLIQNAGAPDNIQEFYTALFEQIVQIDEVLDSTTDQKSAGKRSIKNSIVEETKDEWEVTANSLVEKIAEMDERTQVGVYLGFVRMLEKAFDKVSETYVDNLFDTQPKQEQKVISDKDLAALTQQRSVVYKNLKTMRDLALMFGGAEDNFPMPKVRTGARGPRGKRAISEYSWSVNGVALTGDENSLLHVSKKYEFESVAALRKAIQAVLVDDEGNALKDLKDPPNPIVFSLPNGDTLTGNRPVSENGEDDEDSDEDESE
jgi:hypothetical protein